MTTCLGGYLDLCTTDIYPCLPITLAEDENLRFFYKQEAYTLKVSGNDTVVSLSI